MKQEDYPPLSPYLTVIDAVAAIDFYQRAFGATERYRLIDSTTGKVGHSELLIQGSLLMLGEEDPRWNQSPATLGGTPAKFCLMVADVDAATTRASEAGAEVLMAPADQFYGFRSASLRDPFGHEWFVQACVEDVSPEEMQRRWDAMAAECQQNQP